MYTLSALVQWLSPGPFSEAVLTCILLALAAVATFLVATELTGSIALGVGATIVQIALEPRLYSYPKILVPAVALLLIQHYVRQPEPSRGVRERLPEGRSLHQGYVRACRAVRHPRWFADHHRSWPGVHGQRDLRG
jgi:hypothetical protein